MNDESQSTTNITEEHINSLLSKPVPQVFKHSQVFDEILQALPTINFHEAAGLDEKEKITTKILVVVVVKTVVQAAKDLGVGLTTHADSLFTFNGKYWRECETGELQNFLGNAAAKLGVDKITAAYHQFQSNLLKQFFVWTGSYSQHSAMRTN